MKKLAVSAFSECVRRETSCIKAYNKALETDDMLGLVYWNLERAKAAYRAYRIHMRYGVKI